MDMSRRGDRDKCFFNERCYYPGLLIQTNLPINHIISHIPYFLAGLHLIFQTMLADNRVSWKMHLKRSQSDWETPVVRKVMSKRTELFKKDALDGDISKTV